MHLYTYIYIHTHTQHIYKRSMHTHMLTSPTYAHVHFDTHQAYKEFIKRHPRVFNPPSDIKSQDAAQDPQPSPTHDSGAYHLTEAGIKV